jgi:hypothetical protein
MTVQQLVELLYEMPPDALVAISTQSKDQNLASSVKVYTNEDTPYAKGDTIFTINKLDPNVKIVYIK